MNIISKYTFGLILFVIVSFNTGCNDKNLTSGNMRFCEDEKYRAGEVNAESNLRSYDGYALYSYNEDSSQVRLDMGKLWDPYCGLDEWLIFLKINLLNLNDTIYLNHVSENGITSEYPTANYRLYDHDSPEYTYTLFTEDSVSDWIYIDAYKPESKMITGSFQVSIKLISAIDTTTNNSYPPHIIYFKNGSFEAHAWPTY